MNLIDPLCITTVGALAGALARRFAPRATPRYLSQAVALGAVGAWGGVLLAAWLVSSGSGQAAGLVVAGAKSWACALLGAVIVLDIYHLVRRRQVCWPTESSQRGSHGAPASNPFALQPRYMAQASGQQIYRSGPTVGGGLYGSKLPVMRSGTALDGALEERGHPGNQTDGPQQTRSPKASKRASTFALERKLARKRRLQRARSGSRARAQTGQPGPGRPTT